MVNAGFKDVERAGYMLLLNPEEEKKKGQNGRTAREMLIVRRLREKKVPSQSRTCIQ